MKKYSVFMIDPPWNQSRGGKIKRSPTSSGMDLNYQTMEIKDIFDLLDQNVFPLMKNQCVVFLWVIEKYLIESESEMLKRGFKRHVRMIWDKNRGPCPAFTIRYSHEYLVWYYKPKLIPISKDKRGIYGSVFRQRNRQHSRKPDIAYKMIKDMYPHHSKLDVFSRQKRNGWDQWGNELDYYSKLINEGFGIII